MSFGPFEFSSDDNQVLDNTIISSGGRGILSIGNRNVIQGNTIDQSKKISGISIGDDFEPVASEGVIIKDNSITNSNGAGIEIVPGNLNTVVIGNTLAGNADGNIDDQGDGTVEAGNIEL